MLSYQQRHAEAKSIHQAGLERVRATPAPPEQKFAIGTRVHIAADLGPYMSHFPNDRLATVLYTYKHAYQSGNAKDYCLDVDGIGSVSWYHEDQLTLVPNEKKEQS